MKRILLASSVVCATGCAAAVQAAPPADAHAVEAEAEASRLDALEAENVHRAARIRQLEAQLALSRAEVEELREPAPLEGTVQIGARQAIPPEPDAADGGSDLDPAEETDSGPRPLLRLYGSPAVSLEAGSYDGLDAQLPPLPPMSAVAAPPPASAAPFAPPRPTGPAPRADGPAIARYRAALEHVQHRRFAEAAATLSAFLAEHPTHAYADNALYWRGEALYAMRRYADALRDFERLVGEHPRGGKVPDALLKIALCHRRMGDAARARATFRRLRAEHPESVAARLASEEDAS